MGAKLHPVAWLTVIVVCFACLARCDDPMGFIFPANATRSDPPLDNLTVHFNDNIVVEYTKGTGGIVLLGQDCFNSSENANNGSESTSQTLYLSSSCKSFHQIAYYTISSPRNAKTKRADN
jgi:hypothetical protein